jgi:phosphatidylinositol glycan class U
MFSMIWTIFRPVETLFDMNLSLCFFLFSPRSLARMQTMAFLSLCSLWVPVILNVVDHWMWLEPNTGNPNYMFFQCLAYNVFLGIILVQFCTASLQRDKALRLAAKERETTKE